MQKLNLSIKGMKDDQSEVEIIEELKKLEGVLLVNIDFSAESGVITFNEEQVTPKEIVQAIMELGYIVENQTTKEKSRLYKILLFLAVLLALLVLALELYPPSREYIYDKLNPTTVELQE